MTHLPQLAGNWQRFNSSLVPPGEFIPGLMQITVVRAAERDSELIAHFHAKSSWLGKAQVMGVCGLPATDKARPLGYELKVLFVSDALGLAKWQGGLVDALHRGRA